MTPIDLPLLEIRILLKCHEKAISKRDMTRFYYKHPKADREQALTHLMTRGLLLSQELPKAGAKKTPTFYSLTDAGKEWVKQYEANYPQ